MIPARSLVRLTKVSQETYWLEGRLVEEPTVGHTLQLERTARAKRYETEPDRVEIAGWYVSSPVTEIVERPDGSVACRTANSHWNITILP
jgi:hypothetical protein